MINERFSQLAIEIKRVNESERSELRGTRELAELARHLTNEARQVSEYANDDDYRHLAPVLENIKFQAEEIVETGSAEHVLSEKGEKNYRYVIQSADELLKKLYGQR